MQKTMHLIQIRPFNFVKWSKFFKSDENAGWNKNAGRSFFPKNNKSAGWNKVVQVGIF